jgi:glycosyltransferase involved in cell wall biosynthesis
MMRVLLIEPYYGGSHRAWADSYRQHSRHDIHLLTLPAQFWKWRMQGGAVTLARMLAESDLQPDVILASDMLNLATFRALIRRDDLPIALYFHENQLTYPQNVRQRHGWQYGFINYISALAADAVYFNSAYHLSTFFKALPNMLKHFGDCNELESIEPLREKSGVLPLGLDLRRFDAHRIRNTAKQRQPPLIVWNHRWEDEKNPRAFFAALYELTRRGIPFRVALTGENVRQNPDEFEQARERLGGRVVQYGYLPDFAAYARLLWQADYAVSTSYQDFFGAAITEAIYCGCVPLLPWRLNYPHLVPESQHKACLYRGKELLSLLIQHLQGEVQADADGLREHVTGFDWSVLAPRYDSALEQLHNTKSAQ